MKSLIILPLLVSAALASYSSFDHGDVRDPGEFLEKLDLLDKLVKDTYDRWTYRTDTKCVGGNDCCTSGNRCGIGEGDCDGNGDCMEGLVCGERGNCDKIVVPLYEHLTVPGASFSTTDNCCELKPELLEYFEDDKLEE